MNDTEFSIEIFEDLLDKGQYRSLRERLVETEPVDIASFLENVALEKSVIAFRLLPKDFAVRVFEFLDPNQQQRLLESFGDQAVKLLLEAMAPDDRADLLDEVPAMVAKRLLRVLSPEQRLLTMELLGYKEGTAGRAMTPYFVDLRSDMTSSQALQRIRDLSLNRETVYDSYVMDEERHLLGIVSLKDLVLADQGKRVLEIMRSDPRAVDTGTDQELAATILRDNNLLALPVVDGEYRLVGIITWDDVADILEEEATEDMYKLAGITGERVYGPLRDSLRNRLPWLTINLATTFLAALVISMFESTIARAAVLAVFLPVVSGQGGIGGTQTLTLVVRSMVLREITGKRNEIRLIAREVLLGVMHGLLLALLVGLVAFIWKGNYMLGVVLGLAMLGNMIIAGLTGAGVPLLLARFKIDPAVASAVLVTTFTDIAGFFLFLGLAYLMISYLL
ncbi:MAG: magnesium transporter [Dehalococcoidales bacterium]|nr:magnesium transporter [Dehalococcoidales bacterium]